jgi:hypothetical protein
MSYYFFNFSRRQEEPWLITETNQDRTELLRTWGVSEIEVNVPCKTFLGKLAYFACEGVITLDGTKAIINAE